MRRIRRRIVTVVFALAALLGVTVTAPQVTAADAKQTCEQQFGAPKDTAKTPAILIHGLWSDRDTLAPIADVLDSSGIITYRFDYESANDRWVTEGDTAHRLAKTIVCFSKLYGDKDVVLVAHSKGGLLARAALDWATYGTFAKDVTGHVITLGTPHKGADMAQVASDVLNERCNMTFVWWGDEARKNCETVIGTWSPAAMAGDSGQLAELPDFPRGITVNAMAGEVEQEVCAPWGCSEKRSTGGDLVVSVESATAEYTTTGNGDGKKVFSCTDPIAIPQISHPWCEHNAMLQAPQVQNEVKASIQAYLASVKPAGTLQFTQKLTLGNLVIPAPKSWVVQDPGVDPVTVIDDQTCGSREYGDYWKLCARFTVHSDGDSLKEIWDMSCPGKLRTTTKSNIGGKVATLYKYGRCDALESPGDAQVWHIPGGVGIEYHFSAKDKPMIGIHKALAAATRK